MNDNASKPNLALLIDADNISAKYLPIILNEIPRYGVTTYRRIYGDFTDPQAASWRQKLLDHNITPIQQFSNVKSHKKGEKAGKNATDSTLIIDAMDILYAGKVDGFVIVSSDSDFTRLASRLRESNMLVVGMGRNQTAISFRHACTKFVNIEALYKMEQGKDEGKSKSKTDVDADDVETTVTLADVESVVAGIIRDDANKGREATSLAILGGSLNDKFPDFDVRNFGYSQLYKLIEELGRFELIKVENGYNVRIKEQQEENNEIRDFIVAEISKRDGNIMGIAPLATKVYKAFPAFNIKDTGYSQFYKYAGSFPQIEIVGEGARKQAKLVKPAQPAKAEAKKHDEGAAEAQGKQSGGRRTRRRRNRSAEQQQPQPEAEQDNQEAQAPAEQVGQQAEPESAEKPAEQATVQPQPQDAAKEAVPDAQEAVAEQEDEKSEKPAKAAKPAKKRRQRKAASEKEHAEVQEVAPAGNAPTISEVYAYLVEVLQGTKGNTMGTTPLASRVRKRFPEFDLEATGYKKFYQFANGCNDISITGEGRSRRASLAK